MARKIVNNLKFKKYAGDFDPKEFSELMDEAYLNTKRANQVTTKTSFSPSSFGYGHGNCSRYWYMAFKGAMFIDNNDSIAIANMKQGTQAHERIQKLIKSIGILKHEELEVTNVRPPIRGFIDIIIDWHDKDVIGEIKTAKQEVWDSKQASMTPSENHLLQILTYMKLMDISEGFFLYENKNTQELLVIPVQMNEKNKKIIDDLFLWLSEVHDNILEGDLPFRPYTKSSYTCKNCPIYKECWSSESGTVQIEPYSVSE